MSLARKQASRANQGYSLVELLLTLGLLLLFSGLAVVSMRAMSQGSSLKEGTIRFETLLRFARAQSAYLGRRVRVDFVQDTNQVAGLAADGSQLNHIQLSWEPNPATEPGVFQDLLATRWGLNQVNETVGVEAVQLNVPTAAEPAGDEDTELTQTNLSLEETAPAPTPGITFNPDGSCDFAKITLASRDTEDTRRVLVQLEGFTGTVTHREPAAPNTPEDGNGTDPTAPSASTNPDEQ